MKKSGILLFIFIFSLLQSFAQISQDGIENDLQVSRKADLEYIAPVNRVEPNERRHLNDAKSENAWTQDFESPAVNWTIVNESPAGTARSNVIWEVGTAADFNNAYIGQWFGNNETIEAMFRGGKAVYIDIVQEILNPAIGRSKGINSYIQFEADLTSLTRTPKFSFYQQIRTLNREEQWLEWIIGTNWELADLNDEINYIRLNENLPGNTAGNSLYEVLMPGAEGNAISFRIRWKQTYGATTQHAYFWLIDDIAIDNAPDYDLVLEDYRVNFFEFVDYHSNPSVSYDDPKNNYNFHSSSHVGQFPKSFANDGNTMIGFSACTKNMGHEDAIADIKVTVVHEETNTTVYQYTMAGNNLNISNTLGDTLDVWGNNAWTVPADVDAGKYLVNFEVLVRNQEDEVPESNIGQAIFYITDDIYSRDPNSIDKTISPNNWTLNSDGTTGSAFGFPYTFVEDEYISSIGFFVGARSTVGTSIEIEALYADPNMESYALITSSTYIFEEEDGGMMVNIPFEKVINARTELDPESGKRYSNVRFNFHFNYGNDNTLEIGFDNTQKSGYYASLLLFGESWSIMNEGNPGVHLKMFNIVDRYPAVNSTDVAVDAEFYLKFSDSIPLRMNSLNYVRIIRVIDNFEVNNVFLSPDVDNPNRVIINHDNLIGGTEYKVVIPEDIIKGYDEIVWTFTTAGNPNSPIASVTPSSSWNAGDVILGENKVSGTYKLKNVGVEALTVSNITSLSSPWSTSFDNITEISLGAGQEYSFTFNFTPESLGSQYENFVITTNGGTVSISLSGICVANPNLPAAELTSNFWNAGDVILGSSLTSGTFKLKNVGSETLTVSNITDLSSPWSTTFDNITEISLNAGQEYSFTFNFAPESLGIKSENFVITTNGGTVSVSLSGNCIEDPQSPEAELSVSSWDAGDVRLGSSLTSGRIKLKNIGGGTLTVSNITNLSRSWSTSFSNIEDIALTSGREYEFTFEFKPTSTGEDNVDFVVTTNAGVKVISLKGKGVDPIYVSNEKQNDVYIYPNPSTGLVNIEASEVLKISLIDISGRIIGNYNLNQGTTLTLEQSAGIYYIRAENNKGIVSTYKLVIQ